MDEHRHNDGGFNLLELMMVSTILAILVAIAMLAYLVPSSNARKITCEANQRTLTSAVSVYRAEVGADPTSVLDLAPYVKNFNTVVQCPNRDGVTLEYIGVSGTVTCVNHPLP